VRFEVSDAYFVSNEASEKKMDIDENSKEKRIGKEISADAYPGNVSLLFGGLVASES